jgi:hypothetical protein
MDHTLTVQTCLQYKFPLPLSIQNFLLQGDGNDYFHSEDCCFVCGPYTKHHVASPVITLLRNLLSLSAISMRSLVMFIHVSLCSCASIQSTKFWQRRHMFNTSWRIVWQLPTEIPTCNAIWSTDFLLSLLTVCGTWLTFALSVDIDGWPLHTSSSTLWHPSWKHLCQTHTCDVFIALSPYASCNMFHISAGDFRSQTQNLIFVHCSITAIFNCDVTSHTLKKQISAIMPSEVMKWHNYFCDDVMHGANLRQKFPWCSNSCKLHKQIPGTFCSYYG